MEKGGGGGGGGGGGIEKIIVCILIFVTDVKSFSSLKTARYVLWDVVMPSSGLSQG